MKAMDLSLAEAADGLARGEFTSVELTRAALERAGELGPKLNCIARLDAEDALAQAEVADRERKAGRSGPLLGVPLAHKDLFYVRGKVVACGSKIRRDFVPETTASVLTRLADAGAVNIGSLHMAEFAFSPTGYNEHYGHARNPWNTAHVPAARRADREPRWPRASSTAPWGPIPAARSATRRRCAASPGSSPP